MANKYKKGKYSNKKAMGGDIHSSSRIINSNTPQELFTDNLKKQAYTHLLQSGFSNEEAQQYLSTPQGQAIVNMFKNNAIASNTEVMPIQFSMGGSLDNNEYWPPEEKFFKGLSDIQKTRRSQLQQSVDKVVSTQGNDESLKRLLALTSFMENDLGINPEAYNRDYTSSPMSIDKGAVEDLLEPRGENKRFTASQKRAFAWLEENFR